MQNCILKIFSLRQFYWIVFSKHFLWGNSAELYSQTLPLKQFYGKSILKIFPFKAILRNYILTLSPLGQFYRVASNKCLRTLYPYVNKLMVTKWDVVLALVFIYCINSTNERHLLTSHFATINFTFLHFSV